MQVGDKLRFKPAALTEYQDGMMGHRVSVPVEVTGVVVWISPKHRIYRVAYDLNGTTLYEAFKIY